MDKSDSDRELVDRVTAELRELAKSGLRHESYGQLARLIERLPMLRRLAAADAAGPHPTDQFRALTECVKEAVERLPSATSHDEPVGAEEQDQDQRDYLALRYLLGLTQDTRRMAWPARQRRAADVFHLSWDRFRHAAQQDLLRRLAEQLLVSADQASIESIDPTASARPRLTDDVTVHRRQVEAERELIMYIQHARPSDAILLEFSCATAKPILLALRDVGCSIRLMMCHPASAVSEWQRRRIEASISDLRDVEFRDYERLAVRFYHLAPSLRGRRIGEYVMVGWYTHRDDPRRAVDDPEQVGIWGHDNAVVLGNTRCAGGEILADWFRREFDHLWRHRRCHPDPDLFPARNGAEYE